jgi:probable HAF family extracellular repeat protein
MTRSRLMKTVPGTWITAIALLSAWLAPQSRAQSYTAEAIPTLGGTYAFASSINDFGTVVGTSTTAGDVNHAFSYSNGTITDLGPFSGTSSGAGSINNSGTIVGQYSVGPTSSPFSDTTNGTPIPQGSLGTLGGSYSYADAVNDAGTVVGVSNLSGDSAAHAVAKAEPDAKANRHPNTLTLAETQAALPRPSP